jgi:hypothetical protein
MDRKNFVEWGNSPFSERAFEAAREGRLNSWPLLDTLEQVHAVTRGLEQIFKIAQANGVQQLAWEDKDDEDTSEQPPLAANTVESLLALGEVVSRMLVSSIEKTSSWADKYGIREPVTADLEIAARASVTRSRAKNANASETEREHA